MRHLALPICVLVLCSAHAATAQTVERPKVLATQPTRINNLTMGGEGRWLASFEDGDEDSPPIVLRFWDLRTLKPIEPPSPAARWAFGARLVLENQTSPAAGVAGSACTVHCGQVLVVS